MSKYTQIAHKINNIGFSRLCIIVFYRIKLLLQIYSEKFILAQNFFSKSIRFTNTERQKRVDHSFLHYFSLCSSSQDVIKAGDKLLEDKVTLFGTQFHITESDWLQDPISKKFWDKNMFFTDSKVEKSGYGDVKYVMELNKMYHLVTLAQSYYLTKDDKYLKKVNGLLTNWRVCVPYEKSVVNKSMLDIVFRCFNLIHISLLSFESKLFQEELFPQIIEILKLSERQIRRFSTPKWCKYSTGANHTIGEMVGLIVIQLWIQHFSNAQYDKYLKEEYRYLYASLNNIISKEGVYLEQSAGYSKLVAEFLMLLDLFNSAIGNKESKRLYTNEYLHRLLRYVVLLSNNNNLPNFGDNDGARAVAPFYESDYSVSHLIKYFHLLYPHEQISNTLTCKESGQFIWKSNDEKNVSVFIRSGKHSYLPIGSGSHAHNDILSLLLSVNDKEIFIDWGTYLYNSGLEILNKDRATSSHNTISINGIEQGSFSGKWMYGSYPTSSIIEDKIKVGETYFSFAGKCTYANREHTRIIGYENNSMLIEDQVKCNDKDIVQINFILASSIEINKTDNNSVNLLDKGKLVASMTFNNDMDVIIEDSAYHPSYAVEKKTKKIVGKPHHKGTQTLITKIQF